MLPGLARFLHKFPWFTSTSIRRGHSGAREGNSAMGNDDNIEKSSNKALERRKKTRRLEVKRRRKIRSESEKTIRRTNQGRRNFDQLSASAPKSRAELSTGLTGFCILTSAGRLGAYNEKREFVVNTRLSRALMNYTVNFLKAYESDSDIGNRRIAIICQSKELKPWGTDTLIMEDSIVRRLYPLSGQMSAELTAFQKKNQENSVYRGMELFLEWHDEAIPGIPIFCPVLYDRGTTLADYRSFNFDDDSWPKKTPVIEVVNLLAPIPVSRRNAIEIMELIHNVHGRIVKKELRKSPEFCLVDDIYSRTGINRSTSFARDQHIAKRAGSPRKMTSTTANNSARSVKSPAKHSRPGQSIMQNDSKRGWISRIFHLTVRRFI